jgi:hypothetical protein
MMANNYAQQRIRKYFFRKVMIFLLRLTWLKISVVNALYSWLVRHTLYLNQILMEYGAPQLLEKEVIYEVKEDDLHTSEKSIREMKPDYTGNMDYENEICHDCPKCESNLWNLKVSFEDYEISQYLLPMECAICGSYALAPTLVDKPYVS